MANGLNGAALIDAALGPIEILKLERHAAYSLGEAIECHVCMLSRVNFGCFQSGAVFPMNIVLHDAVISLIVAPVQLLTDLHYSRGVILKFSHRAIGVCRLLVKQPCAIKTEAFFEWLAMPMFCRFRLVRETHNLQQEFLATLREVQCVALATSKQLRADA